ncbi:MAG: hypothetical protein GY856_16285 [bacterium]|nr:hypothetical protein [bacterium]
MSRTETVVDMSPEAIDRRLRTLSGLYQLAMSFKDIKWLGKAKDLEARRSGQSTKDSDQER